MHLRPLLLGSLFVGCSTALVDDVRDLEREVLAAEDAYVAAELARDADALDRLVDDRFVYNGSDGTTSDKDALIRSVLGLSMTDQQITERSVVVDGDLAVVFGTTALRFEPPDAEVRTSTSRYTAVYVNRRGSWKMLALHMSPRLP